MGVMRTIRLRSSLRRQTSESPSPIRSCGESSRLARSTTSISQRRNDVKTQCPRCYHLVTGRCGPNCAWDWEKPDTDEGPMAGDTLLTPLPAQGKLLDRLH